MTDAPERAEGRGEELARMLATLVWIAGAAALSLALLGALPAWIGGEPAGLRRISTVAEAERRLGARVVVPGYFPARLGWPPAAIAVAGGRRGSVRLLLAARDGGPDVELLESTREGEPVAPELLGSRTVLRSDPTSVEGRPATLSEVLAEGVRTHELAWHVEGRSMILRSAGDLDELFRMARSAHREGGR